MARQLDHGERGGASLVLGGKFVSRLFDRAVENPAASGGLLVMALTAGAIAVNATFLQSADHPHPNLAPHAAPRAAPAAPVPGATVPLPRTREDLAADAATPSPGTAAQSTVQAGPIPPQPIPFVALPGTKAAAPPAVAPAKPGKTTPAPAAPPVTSGPTLIADVQRELARLGLYNGAIDGIAGSRTKAAIASYQTSASLPATGVASPELLALMKRPAPPAAAAAAKPATAPVMAAQPAPIKPPTVPVVSPAADAASADVYRRVEIALNQAGYGPIPVDGMAGKETADAIRRFQLDYGMPITGTPDDAVMKRLAAIGAMPAR